MMGDKVRGIKEETGEGTRLLVTDDYYPYLYPVPESFKPDVFASDDDKWAVLASIGIEKVEGRTPLSVWRDAVADASGIEREKLDPKQGGALDTGFSPAYVRKWIFYLA